ncbi:MAG: TRADD-N-associated membrane domain-containing protein, partial [bacterium]
LQAYESFRFSRHVAMIGFLFLVAMFVAMVSLHAILEGFTLETSAIGIIAGVMTTFISGTCFVLYRESLRKMESFHIQLREVQKIVFGLYLNGTSGNTTSAQEERKKIFSFLLHADEGKEPDEALRPNAVAA